MREGYAGYSHFIEAEHAWCRAHLLRELRAVHAAPKRLRFTAMPALMKGGIFIKAGLTAEFTQAVQETGIVPCAPEE